MWSPTIHARRAGDDPRKLHRRPADRLSLYRRLSALEDEAEIDAMGAEIVDRFGPPPPEVEPLVEARADQGALPPRRNVEKLDAGPKGLTLAFRDNSFANPTGLVKWVDRARLAGARAAGHADRRQRRFRGARRPAGRAR